MTDFVVQLLPSNEIHGVAPVWLDLESRIGAGRLMNSWIWTQTWIKHYGDIVPHKFAVGRQDGQVRGLALVTSQLVRRGPFKIRTIHLGTAGEPEADNVCVEYNHLLTASGDLESFVQALLSELRKDPSWDELCLDGFDPAETDAFMKFAPATRVDARPMRIFDFSRLAPEQSVADSLAKNIQKKIDYSHRKLGAVSGQWAQTPEEARDIFSELKKLHQNRWNVVGKSGVFSSRRFEAFHDEILSNYFPENKVFFYRAKAGNTTLACLYGFIEKGKVRFYQSGVAQLEDNKIAPGFVSFLMCMEECRKRGSSEFDFMEGDLRYKREICNTTRELHWAVLRRPRLKFKLIDHAKKIRSWARPAPAAREAVS